jgi:hypothetical protein
VALAVAVAVFSRPLCGAPAHRLEAISKAVSLQIVLWRVCLQGTKQQSCEVSAVQGFHAPLCAELPSTA